jgi:hypothetical protein
MRAACVDSRRAAAGCARVPRRRGRWLAMPRAATQEEAQRRREVGNRTCDRSRRAVGVAVIDEARGRQHPVAHGSHGQRVRGRQRCCRCEVGYRVPDGVGRETPEAELIGCGSRWCVAAGPSPARVPPVRQAEGRHRGTGSCVVRCSTRWSCRSAARRPCLISSPRGRREVGSRSGVSVDTILLTLARPSTWIVWLPGGSSRTVKSPLGHPLLFGERDALQDHHRITSGAPPGVLRSAPDPCRPF